MTARVDTQAASDTATRLRRFATGEVSAEAFQREEGAPLRDAVGALLDSHAALAALVSLLADAEKALRQIEERTEGVIRFIARDALAAFDAAGGAGE